MPSQAPFQEFGTLKQPVLLSVTTVVLAAALVTGCASNSSTPPPPPPAPQAQSNDSTPKPNPTSSDQQVIAKVNGRSITMAQLQQPLVEGYGLNVLLNLIQLELAQQGAEESQVTVNPQDITAERERTLEKMFQQADKSQYAALLEQFLQQQRVSRPEFDLVIQTNAYLRKIAEPQIKGKITE